MELDKKQLRKKLIQMRLTFDENQKQSHFIIEKLKKDVHFKQSKKIGIYLSYRNEVDTWKLIQEFKEKKEFYVPIVRGQEMYFTKYKEPMQKNKYGILEPDEKIDEYAYIPLISNDGGEYVGISEDSYNKLTKNKKEHIKQGEVKAVLEKSKQDDENMFQDKHVYLKTATGMRKFAIKKEVKEVLFVAQQSDIIRILVMNNSDFDMLRSLQKKNTVIMTQQTEKETAIDEGKLKVCEKKYEIIGFYKGSLMKEDRQDDLTTLIFYICIGAFLIISGIMILSIKIWSDISNVSMKYGFLKKIGMETKEIKKNVKKELSLSLWIAFILSIVISGGALSYITWNVDWLLKKQVLITFFALLLFQAGYIILLREYGWRLANQQIQSERREKIWK